MHGVVALLTSRVWPGISAIGQVLAAMIAVVALIVALRQRHAEREPEWIPETFTGTWFLADGEFLADIAWVNRGGGWARSVSLWYIPLPGSASPTSFKCDYLRYSTFAEGDRFRCALTFPERKSSDGVFTIRSRSRWGSRVSNRFAFTRITMDKLMDMPEYLEDVGSVAVHWAIEPIGFWTYHWRAKLRGWKISRPPQKAPRPQLPSLALSNTVPETRSLDTDVAPESPSSGEERPSTRLS